MSEAATAVPFGRLAAGISSADLLLTLEQAEGKKGAFERVDALAAMVICRSLRGERVVTVERKADKARVSLNGVSDGLNETLVDAYSVDRQHTRGAWFLPERANLKTGLLNLPAAFETYPRFAHHVVADDWASVVFSENPSALFIWGMLKPFFSALFLPLELRATWSGVKSREDQLSAWEAIDKLIAALGLQLENELAVMRYGGGWSKLSSERQLDAKQAFLATISAQTTGEIARHYRAYCCINLIQAYYAKAHGGRATRRRVLNHIADKKTIVTVFEGDWLRFLDYLGEQPHPDERLVTAIPQTKFFVGGMRSPAVVAEQKGVPVEEVERVLSSFWDTSGSSQQLASPVERRVKVLREFWTAFDEIHNRQSPGMPSLWGLVEESRFVSIGRQGPDWFHPQLYRKLIPANTVEAIEKLWGTVMLPQVPHRVVSEISPQGLMGETFGPALSFWHGCGLTAWFICEGPYSRTDIQGMPVYYHRQLTALVKLPRFRGHRTIWV
jgi:hypothetical protein